MSAFTTLEVVTLLTIQCARRFYETQYVQIFSSHSKINITHYIVGYFHYFGAFLVIISQAPGFVRGTDDLAIIDIDSILPRNLTVMLLFFTAWYQQCRANFMLANLRKNRKGKIAAIKWYCNNSSLIDTSRCLFIVDVLYVGDIVTEKHLLPDGGFFDFVSSPHMFFEILMYIILTLVLYANVSWWWVLLWVVSNQLENAWLTHKWYLTTFKNYPKERRAIIPGYLWNWTFSWYLLNCYECIRIIKINHENVRDVKFLTV